MALGYPTPQGVLFDYSFISCALQNAERLDSEIIYDRDFDYDYFGFKVREARRCVVLRALLLSVGKRGVLWSVRPPRTAAAHHLAYFRHAAGDTGPCMSIAVVSPSKCPPACAHGSPLSALIVLVSLWRACTLAVLSLF